MQMNHLYMFNQTSNNIILSLKTELLSHLHQFLLHCSYPDSEWARFTMTGCPSVTLTSSACSTLANVEYSEVLATEHHGMQLKSMC